MSAFLKKQIALYRSLKPCFCPAIQETVYFTSDGLHHLLYNSRRPRNHSEKHYRAGLIPHLTDIISNATKAEQKIIQTNPKVISIWNLKHEVQVNGEKKVVKVLLKKEGAGNVKFLSTMSRKTKKA